VSTTGELAPDSSLQQVVTRSTTIHAEARLSDPIRIDVLVPWARAVGGCLGGTDPIRKFTVIGFVVQDDSSLLKSARIRLKWTEAPGRGSQMEVVLTSWSDEQGRFVACGIPASTTIEATTETDSGVQQSGSFIVPERTEGLSQQAAASQIRTMTFVLRRSPTSS
jgi:hypothetical protein